MTSQVKKSRILEMEMRDFFDLFKSKRVALVKI